MKKAKIDGTIVDVISFEDFCQKPDSFPATRTAVETNGMVFPIRKRNDTRPGMYSNGTVCKFIKPQDEESEEYDANNIIDFTNIDNITALIQAQDEVKSLERSILTNVDNVYVPNISEKDSVDMAGLKSAIAAKECDIIKYKDRIGTSADNDFRLLSKSTITSAKMKTLCSALDIKVTMIFEDAAPDVPNPMGKKITVELTSRD